MKVGIPREVKNHEYRVAITPAGVHELVAAGHEVMIATGRSLNATSDSQLSGLLSSGRVAPWS